MAWLTKGGLYLARTNTVFTGWGWTCPTSPSPHECVVCRTHYALPDIADCPAHDGPICSLCCSLDSQCGDVCPKEPTAGPVLLPVPQLPPSSGRDAAREA
ncbi:hypothetical protein [Streptomyces sp. NPDC046925]|uniref:hypothetical protein n=1 Tax=Streptomyces sp. NPDC046925 TaxID=3155375 RepID=UPI0034043109